MLLKLTDSLSNLKKANNSLHAALNATPRNDLIGSAIIKNFEFNYELSWKALRRLLQHHGIPTSSPRQAIAEAFRKQLINNEEFWLKMLEDRNLTVHTYDEGFAREMVIRIEEKYTPLFDELLKLLTHEVEKS